MVSGVQKAFPACVRSVKRGDVYYADFGSVEDAVGHELAKKRPVLIIQNNLGNKKSTTTICLCLSTKCKYGLPYHVHFNDLNIVNRESDICAEQIKTIDQCRSSRLPAPGALPRRAERLATRGMAARHRGL